MKIRDFKNQLREMDLPALTKKLAELEGERERARLELTVNKLEKTNLVKTLSDQVARIKTIIKEKQVITS